MLLRRIKALVKFYQFLLTSSAKGGWKKMRPGRPMTRRNEARFFLSLRSCEDRLSGFFLFFSTARNSIDWTRMSDGLVFPAREDPWPLLPGSIREMLRYAQITPRERDVISSRLTPKITFSWDSPDLDRSVFLFSKKFGYVKNFLYRFSRFVI